jgi:hypothetical protein
MKTATTMKLAAAILFGSLTLMSCTTPPPADEMTSDAAYVEGVPGGVVVNTYHARATVTGIDKSRRKVTVLRPNGKKNTFNAGPEVVNFDQIKVGDQVNVVLVEQVVVHLREAGAPSHDGQAELMVLAEEGEKPAGMIADTVEVTATVTAVNLKRHQATLLFPDGHSETVVVRPDVPLSEADLGRKVVINITEAIAISVETPSEK